MTNTKPAKGGYWRVKRHNKEQVADTVQAYCCYDHQQQKYECNEDDEDQGQQEQQQLDKEYHCTSLCSDWDQDNLRARPPTTGTLCLSTIMEILPLILLLTMGVIISTTCAKYTFHQVPPTSSPIADSKFQFHHHQNSYPNRTSSLVEQIVNEHAKRVNLTDVQHRFPVVVSDGSKRSTSPTTTKSSSSLSNLMMMMQNDDEYSKSSSYSHQHSGGSSQSNSGESSPLTGNMPLDTDSTTDQSWSNMSKQRSFGSLYRAKSSQSNHHQQQMQMFATLAQQYSVMRLRWLSNSSVTCNDGTRAGYYIRHSPTSKRWLIYLEGGWYCMSKSACDQRWSKMREYMTSFRWSQYKTFNGILSSSRATNPYWWDANHVFIPYCSSDIWSGDSAPPNEMAFLGSRIIDEVINELTRSPVYRFTEARFVLLAGSSAGAAGVMINLDRVANLIANSGSRADVRGLADSGWILDSEYLESKLQPQQQQHHHHQHHYHHHHHHHHQQQQQSMPNKVVLPCVDATNCSPADTIKGAYRLWNSRVPTACAEQFPYEPWKCYFGYRLYPSLRTPLFVVQYQYDEFQIYMDGMTSRAWNEQNKRHYIRSLSDTIRRTLANVSAVFAPSCMSHIMLTKLDWHKVSIGGVTLPEALHCWEQNPYVVNHPKQVNHRRTPVTTTSAYRQNGDRFVHNVPHHHNDRRPISSLSSSSSLPYSPLYQKVSSATTNNNNFGKYSNQLFHRNVFLSPVTSSSDSSSSSSKSLSSTFTLPITVGSGSDSDRKVFHSMYHYGVPVISTSDENNEHDAVVGDDDSGLINIMDQHTPPPTTTTTATSNSSTKSDNSATGSGESLMMITTTTTDKHDDDNELSQFYASYHQIKRNNSQSQYYSNLQLDPSSSSSSMVVDMSKFTETKLATSNDTQKNISTKPTSPPAVINVKKSTSIIDATIQPNSLNCSVGNCSNTTEDNSITGVIPSETSNVNVTQRSSHDHSSSSTVAARSITTSNSSSTTTTTSSSQSNSGNSNQQNQNNNKKRKKRKRRKNHSHNHHNHHHHHHHHNRRMNSKIVPLSTEIVQNKKTNGNNLPPASAIYRTKTEKPNPILLNLNLMNNSDPEDTGGFAVNYQNDSGSSGGGEPNWMFGSASNRNSHKNRKHSAHDWNLHSSTSSLSSYVPPLYSASKHYGSNVNLFAFSPSSSSLSSYWNDYTHSKLPEPTFKCQYRLIDEHSYPERNADCPRLYKPYMD